MPTIDSKLQQIYGIWALGALIPAAGSLIERLIKLVKSLVGIQGSPSLDGGREAL